MFRRCDLIRQTRRQSSKVALPFSKTLQRCLVRRRPGRLFQLGGIAVGAAPGRKIIMFSMFSILRTDYYGVQLADTRMEH